MAVNDERTREEELRIARLYRLASAEEPPARLDTSIAAAARRPATRGEPETRVPWWQAWRVPFAFAAVAVVSVSLVTLMLDEGGERVRSVPPSSQPPAVGPQQEAPQAEREAQDAPAAKAESRLLERSSPPSPARQQTQPSPPRDSSRDPARPTPQEPTPFPDSRPAAGAQTGALQNAAPFEEPSSGRREAAPAPATPPARARAAAESAPAEGRTLAAPAPAAKPSPAPAATIGTRGLSADSTAPPSSEVARLIAELEGEPPSTWLERIAALRRDARRVEADGLLAEFRRRYPGHPVPESLQ